MAQLMSMKCVVVGDGAVGKTCMLQTFSLGHFPKDYVPTVFDTFNALTRVDGKNINLSLWDTAGQETYDRLRLLSYPQTDVVIICFNTCSKTTLENVSKKWIIEVKENCPDKPILLVGTQKDRRDKGAGTEFVTSASGKMEAERLKVTKYLECSALTQENLREVFDEACRVASNPKNEEENKKKKPCYIF